MRFGVSAGSAVLMTMTTAAAAADLDAYADRDPSDKVGGRTICQVPGVRTDFVGTFGRKRRDALQSYGTGMPITALDDPSPAPVPVTRPCGLHDCPNSARALFRRDGTLLGACFVDSGKRTSVESMGPGWKSRQDAQDIDACGQGADEFVKRFKAAEAARR
jgi:hypothetical protein